MKYRSTVTVDRKEREKRSKNVIVNGMDVKKDQSTD